MQALRDESFIAQRFHRLYKIIDPLSIFLSSFSPKLSRPPRLLLPKTPYVPILLLLFSTMVDFIAAPTNQGCEGQGSRKGNIKFCMDLILFVLLWKKKILDHYHKIE